MSTAILDNARAYLAKMPAAIAGQGGHDAIMEAAVVLVRGFALSKADALELLQEYNRRCSPPWKRAELEHKIKSAAKGPAKGTAPPMGYLLDKGTRGRQHNPPPPRDWRASATHKLPPDPADWPPAWREDLEERAAIMAHDGQLNREDAERRAAEIVRANYTRRTGP